MLYRVTYRAEPKPHNPSGIYRVFVSAHGQQSAMVKAARKHGIAAEKLINAAPEETPA